MMDETLKHTLILPITQTNAVQTALEALHAGKTIAFPTDTVYGIAALVNDFHGIERLFEIKGRDGSKAIAVLISDFDQISMVAASLPQSAYNLARRFWPGALTLVVPRLASLPPNLSPNATVGIRMPNHSFARALIRESGPLATTSANLSGGNNPANAQDVYAQLTGRVDLILDGGNTPGPVASTVVDCTQDTLVMLREGVISSDTLGI